MAGACCEAFDQLEARRPCGCCWWHDGLHWLLAVPVTRVMTGSSSLGNGGMAMALQTALMLAKAQVGGWPAPCSAARTGHPMTENPPQAEAPGRVFPGLQRLRRHLRALSAVDAAQQIL